MRLLKDVLAATSAGPPSSEHTEGSADTKERWRRSQTKWQTKSLQLDRHAPEPNGMLLLLAVEALAHENYAAGLVWSAFNYQESKVEGPNNDGKENGESGLRFGAAELDAAMQSLLLHCAGDLHSRLWGGSVRDQRRASGSRFGGVDAPACPYSRLLLQLQEHVVACWGDTDGQVAKKDAARELSLGHAARLLEQALEIFTMLLAEGHQPGNGARRDQHHENKHYHSTVEALSNSFVSLIPALCISVVALPREGGRFLPRAAGLLPLVIPLLKAVNRFESSCVSKSPADSPVLGARSSPGWMTELAEALAMLSSDLGCAMIDMMNGIKVPLLLGLPLQDGGGDSVRDRRHRWSEDMVELLLVSSPFLAFDHESFDWSGTEDGDASQPDDSDFSRALEVILGYSMLRKNTHHCCPISSTHLEGVVESACRFQSFTEICCSICRPTTIGMHFQALPAQSQTNPHQRRWPRSCVNGHVRYHHDMISLLRFVTSPR